MSPSIDPKASWLKRMGRLWVDRVFKPLAMAIVMLVFAVTMVSEVTSPLPPAKAHSGSAANQTITSPLPLPLKNRPHLQQHRMTQATMTSHNLTAAYLLGHHRPGKKLSAKAPTLAKQG